MLLNSPAETLRGADIVATATNSGEPVLDVGLLEPGMHVTFIRNPRETTRHFSVPTAWWFIHNRVKSTTTRLVDERTWRSFNVDGVIRGTTTRTLLS